MPKPVKAKEEKVPEPVETEDGGVEVSIEETDPEETIQEEEREEAVQEEKKKPEQDAFKNKIYAQDRIITKLNKEIEDLKNQVSTLTPSQKTEELARELDDIDKLAQKDWKLAVRKLIDEQYKVNRQQENQVIQEESIRLNQVQRQEQNAQEAVKRHPELNDNSSEKSQIWFGILDKHPDWRTSPEGPLLVMYEMENELRKKGYDIDGTAGKIEQEASRITRASATSLPSSKFAVSSNKVVLTKEQREFCDINGMKYEDYARTLKGGERGVEA